MVSKSILLLLSILAVTSAQLLSVPKRARGDNKLVGKSPQEQDGAFGRKASSNLRKGNTNLRHLEQSMSMSMDFTVDDTADSMTPLQEEAPIEKPEEAEPEVPEPASGQTCKASSECMTAGQSCQCRFNCIFCSDITFLHFAAFCGVCRS